MTADYGEGGGSRYARFAFVQVLEHRVGGLVEELQFVPLVKLAQPAVDGGTLLAGQLGQLIQDFGRAHIGKLPCGQRTGKAELSKTSAQSRHEARQG